VSAETILVASPDEVLRGLLSRILAGPGRTVRRAADAKDAFEAAVRTVSDVVILSLRRYPSGVDGFELLRILRHRGCDAEVIAVASASGRELETLLEARRARVQEVV